MFASLYFRERTRPPTTVRQGAFVEPESPVAASVAPFRPSAGNAQTTVADIPARADRPPRIPHRAPFSARPASIGASVASNYIALRNLVLTRGIDALPQREYTSDADTLPEPIHPPITARALMKEFLPGPTAVDTQETDSTFRQEPTHNDMRAAT